MNQTEFNEYYKKYGKCPNDIQSPKHKLNSIELSRRYKTYLKVVTKKEEAEQRYREKQLQKKVVSIDSEWEKTKLLVTQRDRDQCQFLKCLSDEEFYQFIAHVKKVGGSFLLSTLDPAHIYPKGAYPWMKYNPDNVVQLNRFVHACLDQMKDPITDEFITQEQRLKWFEYMVGKQRMESLAEESKKTNILFPLKVVDID